MAKNQYFRLSSRKGFNRNPAMRRTAIFYRGGFIMAEIEFYDVKAKNKFKTDTFDIREKKGRYFAVAKSPTGPHECWRILSEKQAKELQG